MLKLTTVVTKCLCNVMKHHVNKFFFKLSYMIKNYITVTCNQWSNKEFEFLTGKNILSEEKSSKITLPLSDSKPGARLVYHKILNIAPLEVLQYGPEILNLGPKDAEGMANSIDNDHRIRNLIINWAVSWLNLFLPCANNRRRSEQSDQCLCYSLLRYMYVV